MEIIVGFKGDITGGLTAGIIALPLALAFGIASGLGASAGVWGAIVLGFFAAVFGGTKMQISGPTGPMTVVSAAIVFKFAGDTSSVMAVFVLAGLFQILFGILRLGKFIKFIPYSVVSGFMNGIGVIIILLQINPLLGLKGIDSTIMAIKTLPESILNFNQNAVILGFLTIVILYLSPKRLSSLVPTPLLALLIITPICFLFKIDVATIGAIPTGFAQFVMPKFDLVNLNSIVTYAFILAVLGTIDSLLTSIVADSITKTKHSSNQELIGQGIGNTLVGFVGGIPGAGATMRTVANIKAGGTGRLSGMTHSMFLLLAVLIFAPIISYVPLAVLAGILIKVGFDILDYRLLRRIKFIPKKDICVMIVVFLLTVFVDLIFAVGVGVVLAWFLYFIRVSKEKKRFDIKILDKDDAKFVQIIGPMFFANSSKIVQNLTPNKNHKQLTIDCSKATFMDITFVYALEDFIGSVDKNNTKIDVIIDDEIFSGSAINELKHLLRDNISTKENILNDTEIKLEYD
ncbi:SulP family inorganic anion transporter [Campylobacter mucosalis]|uniref:SulP family inorganic anion transporter n=1 Tax=Campylobacter mucosalis TaxID=202 RepID=UPI00147003B4|nr:SulP family inorganic anion transporter [Campylobacter mucosalis]